jgi:hypothetical protein
VNIYQGRVFGNGDGGGWGNEKRKEARIIEGGYFHMRSILIKVLW